jgi:hypothetical protein
MSKSKENLTKANLELFQKFFRDSRNDPIIETIKELCWVRTVIDISKNPNGESYAYRSGRQDVWGDIQGLLEIKPEQVERKKDD